MAGHRNLTNRFATTEASNNAGRLQELQKMATAAKINRLGATSQEHRSHDVRSRRQPDEGLAKHRDEPDVRLLFDLTLNLRLSEEPIFFSSRTPTKDQLFLYRFKIVSHLSTLR